MRSRLQLAEALEKRDNLKGKKEKINSPVDMPINKNIAKQTTVETDELIQKKKLSNSFEDLEKTAFSLSGDISLALAMEIEDLPTHRSEFRQGMQRAFMHVLKAACAEEKKVIVFNDAIPGFVLMLFKKQEMIESAKKEWTIEDDDETAESQAASVLAEQYFQRTKHRVITVESQDALFVFFPVADLKKNLKEMGFYL